MRLQDSAFLSEVAVNHLRTANVKFGRNIVRKTTNKLPRWGRMSAIKSILSGIYLSIYLSISVFTIKNQFEHIFVMTSKLQKDIIFITIFSNTKMTQSYLKWKLLTLKSKKNFTSLFFVSVFHLRISFSDETVNMICQVFLASPSSISLSLYIYIYNK